MIDQKYPWFSGWWQQLMQTLDRRPSALMLQGVKGTGKTKFATEIAAAWLCQHPLADGSACGQCASCNWMKAGQQHPDFRWVRSDADAEAAGLEQGGAGAGEGASVVTLEADAAEGKKQSQEIRIEQIRALANFANVGSHRGGLRVVLISPANRMNYAASNALLKTLEEPAESLAFILVADSLRGIPATILSRCRRLNLEAPADLLSEIQTQESQAAPWLLPLLASSSPVDPIAWAQKAGKSPPAETLAFLMRWMSDASRVAAGAAPRSFPGHAAALKDQALRIKSPQVWAQTQAEFLRLTAIAEHPLNPKLFYESIFDRLRRASI